MHGAETGGSGKPTERLELEEGEVAIHKRPSQVFGVLLRRRPELRLRRSIGLLRRLSMKAFFGSNVFLKYLAGVKDAKRCSWVVSNVTNGKGI